MNPREKKLLAAFIGTVVVIGVWWIGGKIDGMLDARRSLLGNRTNELSNRSLIAIELEENLERLDAWKERSLPSDPRRAGTIYQNWLLEVIDSPTVRLQGAQVEAARPSKLDQNVRLPFTVSGQGTLDQVTAFLHQFYRSGHLHKITRFTLTPERKSGLLDVRIVIEALMMPEATTGGEPRLAALAPEPDLPLLHGDLNSYQAVINGRHVFSGNEPPQFAAASAPPPAPRSKRFRYELSARDPDGTSSGLKYELLAGPPEARVTSSGVVEWQPPADAEMKAYPFHVKVTDDGIPRRSAERQFEVNVVNAPPELATGDQRIKPLQEVALKLAASDPDGDDEQLLVELVDGPEGAELNGDRTLVWQAPDEPGRSFTVAVRLTDTLGEETTKSFRLEIERPSEPPVARPRGFPHEQHAVLTAVIQKGNQTEAWVNVRTLGKVLKLAEGDQVRVGELEFVVKRIDLVTQKLELEADGRSRLIQLGEPLASLTDEGI